MLKVSEYERHDAECREMARRMADESKKAQLEEIAQAWDTLAREREDGIRAGKVIPEELPPPAMVSRPSALSDVRRGATSPAPATQRRTSRS